MMGPEDAQRMGRAGYILIAWLLIAAVYEIAFAGCERLKPPIRVLSLDGRDA